MTLSSVEELLESTDHNGFPVVVSMESQYLVGFVLRRDLSLAINNAKSRMEGISGETLVLFTNQVIFFTWIFLPFFILSNFKHFPRFQLVLGLYLLGHH